MATPIETAAISLYSRLVKRRIPAICEREGERGGEKERERERKEREERREGERVCLYRIDH